MENLQNIKKTSKFRLTPLSPLLRTNHSHSNTTPTTEAFSLPFISKKQKMKTEPSETQESSPTHFRIHTSPELPSQCSPSSRLLSRLIYNHLQKKITIQQQTFRDVKNNNIGQKMDLDNLPAIDKEQYIFTNKNKKYQRHVYAYEKQLHNSNHPNYTQHVRQRNRLNIQTKFLSKNFVKPTINQNLTSVNKVKSHLTNIDAYFDLSCLQTCKANNKHSGGYNL